MSIIDNAKEIALLVKKLGDIDLYRKIVELEGEIIELTREKRQVEERLADIQRSQEIIKSYILTPVYTQPRVGPSCTVRGALNQTVELFTSSRRRAELAGGCISAHSASQSTEI